MGATGWEQTLHEALHPASALSVVAVVEGAAGTGKSFLAEQVGRQRPEESALLSVSCGEGDGEVPAALEAAAAEAGPLLLVVEDVHLAGRGTLRRLRRWVAGLRRGVGVVLTWRPQESATAHLVLGEPLVCPAHTRVVRRRLGPLSPAAVRQIAHEILGEPPPEGVADRLRAVTGGIAQVVVDATQGLADVHRHRGCLTADDVDALEPPLRLTEHILSWAGDAGGHRRRLLEAAAIVGTAADLPELATVADLESEAARAALSAALTAQVLTEAEANRYWYGVPLAADAVARAVDGPRRAETHLRAAHMRKQRPEIDWPAVVAHLRAADSRRGLARAVHHAMLAYSATGRHAEAAVLLRQVLSNQLVRGEAAARLARTALRLAIVDFSAQEGRTVLDTLGQAPFLPPAARTQAHVLRHLPLCTPLTPGRADWHRLERTARSLPDDPALAARVISGLALPIWPDVHVSEQLRWLDRARTLAATVDDPVLHIAVEANCLPLLLTLGDEHAHRMAATAPAQQTDAPSALQHARWAGNVADALVWLGRYHSVHTLLVRGRKIGELHRAAHLISSQLDGIALLADFFTGHWNGLAERATDHLSRTASTPSLGNEARAVLAGLCTARGEWSQASHWLHGDQPCLPDEEMVPLATFIAALHIQSATAHGDPHTALATAQAAWQRLRRKGITAWAAEIAPWAITAALRAGDVEAAHAMTRDLATAPRGPHVPLVDAALMWCQAALADHDGEHTTAGDAYQASADAYAALPRPHMAALALEAAATCTPPSADAPAHSTAHTRLEQSLRRLTALDARADAARVRTLLRARAPRPTGRPAHHGLSPREQEIAELAGTGMTNRQIALHLHLSPRTVEHHIASIMRKLSLTSRRDLTAYTSPPHSR